MSDRGLREETNATMRKIRLMQLTVNPDPDWGSNGEVSKKVEMLCAKDIDTEKDCSLNFRP
jgi:hypothetical protein